ncbi:MAG: hypothetical protein HW387_998 [Parachlamydiales bacterium]|nr:hypothetical protein [Parachlamydiales bacterium]
MMPSSLFFPNKYFIELGCFDGEGVQRALDEKCFERIYAIEPIHRFYNRCCDRFTHHSCVMILEGEPLNVLPGLLNKIEAPATFWLDGHYSAIANIENKAQIPIIKELDAIQHHNIKTHTILVDHVRLFGSVDFDYIALEDILQKIQMINPQYKISYLDGYLHNDVLLVQIPK